MNYNFTNGLRATLGGAREIAIEHGQAELLPDHVTVALLQTPSPELRGLLSSLSFDPRQTLEIVAAALQRGNVCLGLGEIPYMESSKRLLERAVAISEERQHARIGTDHLFAAVAETSEVVGATLSAAGVSRSTILKHLDMNQSRMYGGS